MSTPILSLFIWVNDLIQRWSSKLDNAFSFIVSKDQKYVASGYGNIVEVWEIATGQEATKVTVTHRGYELTDVQVCYATNMLFIHHFDDCEGSIFARLEQNNHGILRWR